MSHVSQPIIWPIFCFGWKRWVLCTRKHWNDEHLSGAVGNFLGSSSCVPFGIQPHQNQLPICAYVWGEIKRQFMLHGHICSSPYTHSIPSNRAPFEVLLTRCRTRMRRQLRSSMFAHLSCKARLRTCFIFSAFCRQSRRQSCHLHWVCFTEPCWLGEASPRGRTGRVMMSASPCIALYLLRWTFLKGNQGKILLIDID